MRNVEYLSPSAIQTFDHSVEEYYLNYLAEDRPPRMPQNDAMAIGSAFDAYAKSYLYERLFGKNDPKYELRSLFEAQVEPQCRDLAWQHGEYAFECYKGSGALADLMLDMQGSITSPRFEFDVKGVVHGYREGVEKKMSGVTLLGKPDVSYVNKAGKHVVFDFKVNGFYSHRPPSPMQGYVKMRSRGGTNYGCHKNAMVMLVDGTEINVANYLEDFNKKWATQLAIYAWLLEEPVGADFIVGIDQLICDASKSLLPSIKVAEHRIRISKNFQNTTFNRICNIWEIIHSDHIFRDMTLEESQALCAQLDKQAQALRGDGTSNDKWYADVTRD